MCKHLISLTTLILIWAVLVPVAPVNAAVWTGAAGDGDWRNPGNWSGAVPDDGERADIDNASDMIWPALAEGTGNCSQARIGHEATMIGELTVTGGATLNVAGELRLGRKSSNPLPTGTLYISGADTQVLVGERIECGRYGNGIIDMSGGLLRSEAELRLGFRDSGFGTVYLRGGTLEANANPGITVSGGGDTGQGLIDISGGTLALAGDQVAVAEGFVNDGAIIGDYIEISGYPGILGTSAVTVAAWINTDSDVTGTLVGWGPNVDGQRFGFRLDQGRLRTENAGGNVQGMSVINDGTWHHVAVTIQANATVSYPEVKVWVDGQDDSIPSVDSQAYDLTADLDVRIGSRPASDDRYYIGQIDELHIFDRVLSAAEIAGLAGRTAPFDVPSGGE